MGFTPAFQGACYEHREMTSHADPAAVAEQTRHAQQKVQLERKQLERDLASVEGPGKWVRIVVIVLAIAGLLAALVAYRVKTAPPPPAKYVLAEVTTGDIVETIQSTGTVKPVTETQVGAVVSGRVVNVYVDFNDVVKKGMVLADIDPTLFSAQIDSSQAQLASAVASVHRAEANQDSAKIRLDRAKSLVTNGVGSQADVDTAQGAYDVAIADVAAAKAEVSQIGAQLKTNKTNLEYTHIISPIDGVVITRAIDPGGSVAASFQAPVLFTLAEDLRHMRVFADIDEADVGRLKEGMEADTSVDAFPACTFGGKVIQVRYSPVTNAGVTTYSAIIDVENPELKLRPGMTATVTIKSAHADNATRIPNSALRFHPSPPLDDKGNKIPQDPLPKLDPGKGRIYVETDTKPGKEKIEPRVIDIGVTDGVYTEVKSDISGLKIVRDETDAATKKKGLF
jgi:HlyD family secretion protein